MFDVQHSAQPVILCLVGAGLVSTLRRAFPDATVVQASPKQAILLALQPDVCAILVDAGEATRGGGGQVFVSQLRARAPSVAVIAYARIRGTELRTAFALAKAGADDVCIAGVDDCPALLRRVVTAAHSRSIAREIAARFEANAPGLLWGKLPDLLGHLAEMRCARDLSITLGVSQRRLRTHLREMRFPRPKRFLAWCRIIVASRLLRDHRRTTESAGMWLGYSSGPAFRKACRRLVGSPPSQLRTPIALEAMLERLGREMGWAAGGARRAS